MEEKSTFEGKSVKGIANYYLTHTKKQKGITLIALVVTIIVLLILAGISIIMLTGENGILKRAGESATLEDISETKELIKLEIMSNVDDSGIYTNEDVIRAVKKVTDKDVEEKAEAVDSKKGNSVNISDLWVQELITFTIESISSSGSSLGEVAEFSVSKGTTWNQFLENHEKYDWSAFSDYQAMVQDSVLIEWNIDGSLEGSKIFVNCSYLHFYIEDDDEVVYRTGRDREWAKL